MSRATKGVNWSVERQENGKYSLEAAALSVLMDIRDELAAIRARLDCPEVLAVPRTLRSIRNALYPSRRKAKAAS